MLTEAHQKEDLGRAYVQAVAAVAGVSIFIDASNHDYGIDGNFRQLVVDKEIGISDFGPMIEFQLKSTKNLQMKQECVTHTLDVRTYNQLALRKEAKNNIPTVLIVFRLPEENAAWCDLSETEMILRHCCYWAEIPAPRTKNTCTINIQIPRNQLLTPKLIHAWFRGLNAGKTSLTDIHREGHYESHEP